MTNASVLTLDQAAILRALLEPTTVVEIRGRDNRVTAFNQDFREIYQFKSSDILHLLATQYIWISPGPGILSSRVYLSKYGRDIAVQLQP